ncbi:MAG: quinolinate synthase NadA [Candidatus Omnitrophica bacterium]|nr:quinolinate synthase NadA [Candidatus Omnitrophota bacterium]
MLQTPEQKDKKYLDKIKKRIVELKKERNAVIIVHNYQRDEIQEIADISGDSLALSQAAVRTDAKVIVFCGVHFMAESASLLNPGKMVLLPVKEAGCPMADMVSAEKLKATKEKYPDAAVVSYVNSSAAVKAESDICCTSSNAIEIVKSLKNKRVIFVPDKNLGRYVQANVPDKEIILWEGFCPTHIRVQEEEVLEAKKEHPDAEFVAHPECNPDVLKLADHICSTGGMFKFVKASSAREFIIGTESGMLYKLRKDNPGKNFYLPTEHLICPSMKLTTLGWVAHSLEMLVYEVKVKGEIAEKARQALDRMLKVTGEASGAAVSGY